MHLGLIGGIGPAATVVYYQKLAAAMRAADQPLELTLVNADANVLVKNNLADDRAAQARVYAGLIDRLRAAGADCAVITSLGGHFCINETVPLSSLPLVSGVTPLDDAFVSEGIAKVGLLGTAVVMRTKLYGQLEKTSAIAPDDVTETGQVYLDMALGEDQAAVELGRQRRVALLDLLVPQLDLPAPARIPDLVEVDEDVEAPVPLLGLVEVEVHVHVEPTAWPGDVDAASGEGETYLSIIGDSLGRE